MVQSREGVEAEDAADLRFLIHCDAIHRLKSDFGLLVCISSHYTHLFAPLLCQRLACWAEAAVGLSREVFVTLAVGQYRLFVFSPNADARTHHLSSR